LDGYSAKRLWDVRIPFGSEVDKGALVVRRGGTLSGWVEFMDTNGPAPGVSLNAELRLVGRQSAPTRQQQSATTIRAHSDDRGYFSIEDLLPGSYVLEAELSGYGPVVISGIEVAAGQDVLLREPIQLAKPYDLKVSTEPPLDPSGSPWNLIVLARNERSGGFRENPSYQGSVSEGWVNVPVAPGEHLFIQLLDSSGQRVWFSPNFEAPDSGPAELEIRVDHVPIAGEVTLADDPVEATLYFGGRNGAERMEMQSDDQGHFSSSLPRSGKWDVEVSFDDGHHSAWLQVDVPKKGTRDLQIDLPDTLLSGIVVDVSGRPVRDAKVSLGTPSTEVASRSGSYGEFEFRGFSPGPVAISAVHDSSEGRRRSRASELQVAERQSVEGLRLVLEENAPLRGRVLGPRGPVPGALVQARVSEPLDLFVSGGSGRTDENGFFEIDLPARSVRAEIVIAAAGYALTAFSVDSRSESTLELPIDGGELALALGAPETSSQIVAVYQDGHSLPLGLLQHWSRGQGAPPPSPGDPRSILRVPFVAPGQYRVCLLDQEIEMRRSIESGAREPAPIRCVEGLLAPGALLELDLQPPAV
jgi:hypothetical protein